MSKPEPDEVIFFGPNRKVFQEIKVEKPCTIQVDTRINRVAIFYIRPPQPRGPIKRVPVESV